MYINGYFMLLFDLTRDRGASDGHTSLPANGNIRIEMLFSKPLLESIMCLLYLEYDNSPSKFGAQRHDRVLKPKWTPGRFCVRCIT